MRRVGVRLCAMNSSRFADPPAFAMTFGVASATSLSRTCCGVRLGWRPRTIAAAPVTWGVDMEVPSSTRVALSELAKSEVIPTPGAKMSTHLPTLEKPALASR